MSLRDRSFLMKKGGGGVGGFEGGSRKKKWLQRGRKAKENVCKGGGVT